MDDYFSAIEEGIAKCYEIAGKAKSKGLDSEEKVEIPLTKDLAERVEELVGPRGIASRIRETAKKKDREELSLSIAKEVAIEKFHEGGDAGKAIDQAVRTGLAILTEGVLVAPLDGIAEVKVVGDYVDLSFAGPIRSAGGTGQAMSVLIADVVRRELGIGRYEPTLGEIERYKEELPLYNRLHHLQYLPSPREIELIVSNCPICIDGEGTEEEEVTGNRDLPRVKTNRFRGGACLVIAEGLCLKAPKIKKHVSTLKLSGWEFLDQFASKSSTISIRPSTNYMEDLIAGRPVLSHPSRKGGFRLRYGRARTAGLAATAINPATMHLLDDFITVGTQMKMERPGKGTIATPCDEIEGPILLLKNGDLVQVNSLKEASKIRPEVKKIVDLGEVLIPFGEFVENNVALAPASYSDEWWVQELKSFVDDVNRFENPSPKEAFSISEKFGIPLCPFYNLFWHDLSAKEIEKLARYVEKEGEYGKGKLIIPRNDEIKEILIKLGALHKEENGKIIIERYAYPIIRCCGFEPVDGKISPTERCKFDAIENSIDFVSKLSGVKIMPRSPCRIGARMGRPEKAAPRKMKASPHVLYPVGDGGKNRSINKAAKRGKIEVEIAKRKCDRCGSITHHNKCECGGRTRPIGIGTMEIDIGKELTIAKEKIGVEKEISIKGVKGLSSDDKIPEPLEKGILRAKRELYVFKDGTTRFDQTDAPLTHFRPKEIGTPISILNKIGYANDCNGKPLKKEDQLCELKPQDLILSKKCGEYLFKVSKFLDELLEKFYQLPKFYDAKSPKDLIGHLVVGLSPHTSAGVVGRIIGFTTASVCYAHPFFHAAKRRNCFHPTTKIWIRENGGWNYEEIGNFFERRIEEKDRVRNDDFGTEIIDVNDENIYVPSLNSDMKIEYRRIKEISRHRSPSHLLFLKTRSGREIKVTPEHSMIYYKDGSLKKVLAFELKIGDLLPIPRLLNFDGELQSIDLLEEFMDSPMKSKIMIRGLGSEKIKEILKNFVENEREYLNRSARKLQINKKTLYDYISRDSIPLNILKIVGSNVLDLPENIFLGIKGDSVTIKRNFIMDESLAKLIGYYAAEGFARKEESIAYQVTICIPDEKPREEIKRIFKDKFGVNGVEENRWKITISSELIHAIFTDILDCGSFAREKKIPKIIQNSPNKIVASFLSAYFSGDGSISSNRNEIRVGTVSDQLAEDLIATLKRFGITAKKYETIRSGAVAQFYKDKRRKIPEFKSNTIKITSNGVRKFSEQIGFDLDRKRRILDRNLKKIPVRKQKLLVDAGDIWLDEIVDKKFIKFDGERVYNLTVEKNHTLVASDIFIGQCDGDEDAVMLLMDALLNFSRHYVPSKRGGKMDLPLVLTTRIRPSEIDKEAMSLDLLPMYPLEFYKATIRNADPKEIEEKMDLVRYRRGKAQYENFSFTHDTSDISQGPVASAYKTLSKMEDKVRAQLNLAKKIMAVDESDVAAKVIETHFLPDMIGNLNKFSKQSVRCAKCDTNYRRIPIKGVCPTCGGKLSLTVHEGSIRKYLEISKKMAREYDISPYIKQRIKLVEKAINSLFINEKVRKTKLSDFL